jgi:glycerol-3-phosphate dehydrogenase (NAD(P)+)
MARNRQTTYLWGRDAAHVAALRQDRRNRRYLAEAEFPQLLQPLDDLAEALGAARDVLIAVPCGGVRALVERLAGFAAEGLRIAWACKGIEAGTHLLIHEVIEEVLGPRIPTAVVSGPTFAGEAAAGLPAAVTVASRDPAFAEDLVARLHGGAFRAYRSDDLIGVEVAGAVKNVLAIATGVSDGLKFGANTRAALITRGLAEMMRLGTALGGHRETFMGLAGLGDLVLTCTDDQSRNRRVGLALARGQSLEEAVAAVGPVVEGVRTAFEVDFLARQNQVAMPITEQVVRLLKGECRPQEAVQTLLSREPKPEFG